MPEEKYNQRVAEVGLKVKHDIEKAKNNLAANKILVGGAGSISYVRNLRNSVLIQYNPIKQEIFQNIMNSLTRDSNLHGLGVLQELSKKLNEQEAKREKAAQERKATKKDLDSQSVYDKFRLYADVSTKQQAGRDAARPVSSDVLQAQKAYEEKKRANLLQGIVVSLLCAVMDYSIINSVFLNSNMSWETALITAVFSAIVLDVPPYILGSVLQRKGDLKRCWDLRGELHSTSAKMDLRPYTIGSILLSAVIILFFSMYLVLRVILFFGGGDFDLSMHFLLERNFDFGQIHFNSSDFISALVPIVTSVVAFVLGLTKSESYAEHIKNTVAIIDGELQSKIGEYSEIEIECDEAEKNLSIEFDTAKRAIWTYYFGQEPLPKDDGEYRQKVSSEFQRLSQELYPHKYETLCSQLRDIAVSSLTQVNLEVLPYMPNQIEISQMQFSDAELDILDRFWRQDGAQHEETARHLEEIEGLIHKLARPSDKEQ